MKACRPALVVLAVFALAPGLAAQQIDLDIPRAAEEFRFGVGAFNAGRYSDAIVAFSRTLSFRPDDFRARRWLGRAYLHAGFEDAALEEWRIVVDAGQAPAYLRSRIDTLEYRRRAQPAATAPESYSRTTVIPAVRDDARVFRRPAGIAAARDGAVYFASLGTQEVLRLGVNGEIDLRIQGGLEGFEAPMDVAIHGETLFVSEFGRNRISVMTLDGRRTGTLGERGIGPGMLMGPQYLAVDGDGFVYVTEWGTRRVTVFDPDGAFVLSFGDATPLFSGLKRPTGIAVRDGSVWVADRDDEGAVLHRFDRSGNHLDRVVLPLTGGERTTASISGNLVEDIGWFDESTMMITTTTGVVIFDPELQAVRSRVSDSQRRRVSSAVVDANSRLIVTDFDADDITIFEPQGTVYAGLDVRIERVVRPSYPDVVVQVAVHDREGSPIVGLESRNFVVSEGRRPAPGAEGDEGFVLAAPVPVTDASMVISGQRATTLDTVVVLQPRPGTGYASDVARAVSDLDGLIDSGETLEVFAAGEQPLRVAGRPAPGPVIADDTIEALVEREGLFGRDLVALDLAIRRAATELIDAGLRRNVVVVGDGRVTPSAFDTYGLDELADYLEVNGVRLHLVTVRSTTPDPALAFLVEATGGTTRFLYEPRGLQPLVADMLQARNGRYLLRYTSTADGDFGRSYIGVAVEVELFVRSGRDELGFYAPAPR